VDGLKHCFDMCKRTPTSYPQVIHSLTPYNHSFFPAGKKGGTKFLNDI
jgi:hypothetical protein